MGSAQAGPIAGTGDGTGNALTGPLGWRQLRLWLKFKSFIRKILAQAIVAGAGMCFHAFQARNSSGGRGHFAVRLTTHALSGNRFDKFACIEATRVTSCTLGWQYVVSAGAFVAEGNSCFFTDEQ
jgi:hypothetical protein